MRIEELNLNNARSEEEMEIIESVLAAEELFDTLASNEYRKIQNKERYIRRLAKKDKRFNPEYSKMADNLRLFGRRISA